MTPIRCLAARPFCYLRFHIQDGDHALRVDLPDRLQPGSVHGVLVAAVLQVVVVADVLHHLVVGDKVVVLPVLLVLLGRSGCVCGTQRSVYTHSQSARWFCPVEELTWDGVGKSVGVFGDECVLDVSSADSMGP